MKERDGINCEAIVLWKRKRRLHSVITFLTKQKGIINCSVSHRELQRMKDTGYLQPFSSVYITLMPDREYYRLKQIDGRYSIRSVEESLESIYYAAAAGELITRLFLQEEQDFRVYRTVAAFSERIRTKSVRLAVILLGWQLLSLAGFIPAADAYQKGNGTDTFFDELRGITGHGLSGEAKRALGMILLYRWDNSVTVAFPAVLWQELENNLWPYATMQIGAEPTALAFLRELGNHK